MHDPSRVKVTWEENKRGPGMVTFVPGLGKPIFPSGEGMAPPNDCAGAVARRRQPTASESEVAFLIPNPAGTVFFAFPAAIQTEEKHGAWFVTRQSSDGKVTNEGMVIPTTPTDDVVAYDDDGELHIVVKPV